MRMLAFTAGADGSAGGSPVRLRLRLRLRRRGNLAMGATYSLPKP